VLSPADVEVERDVTLLLVDDSPVDRDVSRLTAVLSPVDAEVESEPTLLLVEESPVETDATAL
jgi:hypothetical protein